VINGAEIADAVNLGIPVLCVYKQEYKHRISAYVRGKAGVVCRAYSDYYESKDIIRRVLKKHRKNRKTTQKYIDNGTERGANQKSLRAFQFNSNNSIRLSHETDFDSAHICKKLRNRKFFILRNSSKSQEKNKNA
jgi:hypothetical protein